MSARIVRKARKVHICAWCKSVIPAGEMSEVEYYPKTQHWHIPCSKQAREMAPLRLIQ